MSFMRILGLGCSGMMVLLCFLTAIAAMDPRSGNDLRTVVVMGACGVLALLLFLGLWSRDRFHWAFKGLAAVLFAAYTVYVIYEVGFSQHKWTFPPFAVLTVLLLYFPGTRFSRLLFTGSVLLGIGIVYQLGWVQAPVNTLGAGQPSPVNAICGWLLFGLPSLVYLTAGRRRFSGPKQDVDAPKDAPFPGATEEGL